MIGPTFLALIGSTTPVIAQKHRAPVVNVRDFGAKGDGATDDTAAFQAALGAANVIDLSPGSFRITSPIILRDGQSIRGTGRSGWEPYTGKGPPASAVKTEIVLDGLLAFDARNTSNASINGIAIRARDARQSTWGNKPGFQPGTTGINIAGALEFEARDISFHGLEVGVDCLADRGQSAQMPRIGNWTAHDCAIVFRIVSNDRDFYAARDVRIDGCIAALHCGRIAEIRKCDGFRIENVRFFQCETNSLLIERTPFVAITGATLFETGEATVILRDCQYVTFAGVQVARTGYYRNGRLIQHPGILIENCKDVKFEGLVEQSVGRAFTIRDSTNVSIAAVIGTPFWMTGSFTTSEGAVQIERSRSVLINASFSGPSFWMAVWADAASAGSISGKIVTEGSAGVVRCVQLQPSPLGHIARTSAAMIVQSRSTVVLDELRVLVPPGKSLISRSVELTSPAMVFAVGEQRWRMDEQPEPGGGVISLERKQIHRNDTAEARYVALAIGVYNPTNRPQSLPAGHEVRLSLAIE